MRPKLRLWHHLIVFALVCAGLLYLAFSQMFPGRVTNPKRYQTVLADWQATGLVAHFPPSISKDAPSLRFSSQVKVLQGGAHIQVRYRTTQAEFDAIRNTYTPRAMAIYDGQTIGMVDRERFPLFVIQFHTGDSKPWHPFPNHYTVLILNSKDRAMGSWNHGEVSGLAVDPTTRDVVYFAESW